MKITWASATSRSELVHARRTHMADNLITATVLSENCSPPPARPRARRSRRNSDGFASATFAAHQQQSCQFTY